MDEDVNTEQKIYNFGKRNVFRLDLNESREGFCRRGRGRSFHGDEPKIEKAREPTVESLRPTIIYNYNDIIILMIVTESKIFSSKKVM